MLHIIALKFDMTENLRKLNKACPAASVHIIVTNLQNHAYFNTDAVTYSYSGNSPLLFFRKKKTPSISSELCASSLPFVSRNLELLSVNPAGQDRVFSQFESWSGFRLQKFGRRQRETETLASHFLRVHFHHSQSPGLQRSVAAAIYRVAISRTRTIIRFLSTSSHHRPLVSGHATPSSPTAVRSGGHPIPSVRSPPHKPLLCPLPLPQDLPSPKPERGRTPPRVHSDRTLRDAMAALRLASFTLRPAAAAAASASSGATPAAPRSASFARAARGLPSLRLAPPRRRGDLVRPRAEAAADSYASALSEVAVENGTLEQTVSDLEKLQKIFADETVAEFFDNPTVPREEKTALIDEIAKSYELQPHVVNFINVVVDNFRATILPEIVVEFENIFNSLTGTEVATVTSVVQLESQDLAQIAQHVQKMTGAKNVRLKTQLDPELIAGFTVQYGRDGSSLIDMSVRKQIEEITSEFELPDVPLEV